MDSDENREKDIRILAQSVINHFEREEYYDNSYDRLCCIFCGKYVPLTDYVTQIKIKHDITCPVLIAKDLLT
jgi:hypothetical protein